MLADSGSVGEARAVLDSPELPAGAYEPVSFAAMRAYLDALASKSPEARQNARRVILSAVEQDKLGAGIAVEALARLGETDAALTLADRTYGRNPLHGPDMENLFHPSTAAMRRDPRFRTLVQRLGVLDICRAGKRPDFCVTEDVPVCRDIARR